MTTEKAFEKLMNTPCWFALVGITSKQATYIKKDYKKGLVNYGKMIQLLTAAGGVYSYVWTDSDGVSSYDDTKTAFEELIKRPSWNKETKSYKNYKRQYEKQYKSDKLTISTMVKVLKECGFTIKESWHLPPEINKAC